eukprot:TRINITY_DN6714_c0_g1_i6.p2 TRINITY_DN6714_c0_g1~~TRINITY_DN6714_c0_g1_i6.p2  ORF type:complete len:119 (-),score=18.52 TRINITY_DN6714_c0_g1_i6:1324-1680(-)
MNFTRFSNEPNRGLYHPEASFTQRGRGEVCINEKLQILSRGRSINIIPTWQEICSKVPPFLPENFQKFRLFPLGYTIPISHRFFIRRFGVYPAGEKDGVSKTVWRLVPWLFCILLSRL